MSNDNLHVNEYLPIINHIPLNEIRPSTKRLPYPSELKDYLEYRLNLHQHPYVQELIQKLIDGGTEGLMDADTADPELSEIFFSTTYNPDSSVVNYSSDITDKEYPMKDLDFSPGGAYAIYNWELFFHVPMLIAIHLSKNQRYEEAQRWFHFLFDPTDSSEEATPERYWKVKPFKEIDVKRMEDILRSLVSEEKKDKTLKKNTTDSITKWMAAPFRPHAVANFRQQSYMYKTVMAYLDNLIDWGDSLFRQDTGETIDEALMLYILAAQILGPRPQSVPQKGTVRPQTYESIRKKLSKFGTVLVKLESTLPFEIVAGDSPADINKNQVKSLQSISNTLYFGVPRNEKLLGYWDTVADRLFKIRNSLNYQGIFRQLALFEPPIDPAMLARAAAAGVDVAAIVNGLNQPLPLVRFVLLAQKAGEIIQEVKSLGNGLLSAMEKEDGEAMAILRAKHEREIMDRVLYIKYDQLQEAVKSKEGLFQSLNLAIQRYSFYEMQLGRKAGEIKESIPDLDDLDMEGLAGMKFAMEEPVIPLREIDVNIASEASSISKIFDTRMGGGKIISSYEAEEGNLLTFAQIFNDIAVVNSLISSGLHMIPGISFNAEPWGIGGSISLPSFANVSDSIATASRGISDRLGFEARKTARIGSFERREQDWTYQSNLAAGEITQIYKQLRGAQIREAIAEQELANHRKQMEHAEEIERFLNESGGEKSGKTTNKSLYTWMKREVRGLYAQYFQFAFDIAKKAERALQHELGQNDASYIQYGYLTGKEGLLAGEKLFLDLKRMEMAYYDLNKREYELTKHVSLLQIDPLALVQLRMTGNCNIRLPESIFDMDGPGHYFRRIKTVAVSVPCVVGPYSGVNCTLTLLKSSIRHSPALRDDSYARDGAKDDRFSDYFGSLQSIVTSSAQNDAGMFETNLRDERYLPFEFSGVISEWQLQLPANPYKNDLAQFDYNTISDVILHIRYTAREGGGLLKSKAIGNLEELYNEAGGPGSLRLFSLRHEFPTQWARFKNEKADDNKRKTLALDIKDEHYPFWFKEKALSKIIVLAKPAKQGESSLQVDININNMELAEKRLTVTLDGSGLYGDLSVGQKNTAEDASAVGQFILKLGNFEDLWLAFVLRTELKKL